MNRSQDRRVSQADRSHVKAPSTILVGRPDPSTYEMGNADSTRQNRGPGGHRVANLVNVAGHHFSDFKTCILALTVVVVENDGRSTGLSRLACDFCPNTHGEIRA